MMEAYKYELTYNNSWGDQSSFNKKESVLYFKHKAVIIKSDKKGFEFYSNAESLRNAENCINNKAPSNFKIGLVEKIDIDDKTANNIIKQGEKLSTALDNFNNSIKSIEELLK